MLFLSPGARRFDPRPPRAHPDPTTTQPRALQTPKSRAISCELRLTSRRMRFESKVNGHRVVRSTATERRAQHSHQPRSVDSIGPFSHRPENAPKTRRCEIRREDGPVKTSHPVRAS